MSEGFVETYVMADIDTFAMRIVGPYRYPASRANVVKLVELFAGRPHRALLVDYRSGVFCHTREQFAGIGHVLARGLPVTLPSAYLYHPGQLGHVIAMTRILSENGHIVEAFTEMDEARSWIGRFAAKLRPLRRSA